MMTPVQHHLDLLAAAHSGTGADGSEGGLGVAMGFLGFLDDWAKISGKKGERIVYVRTIVTHDDETGDGEVAGGRSIERVATGQYL